MEEFLQLLRGWERGRPEIEMAIVVDDSEGRMETARDMMKRLTPEFAHYAEVRRKELRLRMKVWRDPETGLLWLAPVAFATEKILDGVAHWGAYLMRDNMTRLWTFTMEEWNTLPFHWFDDAGETEERPGSKPWDMIK